LLAVTARPFFARVIRRLVLLLAVLPPSLLRAQTPPAPAAAAPAPPEATADRNVFDDATGEYALTGNARLSDGTLLLLADDIRYNLRTHVATASGRIQFTRGSVRLLADRLVYNRQDGTFTAENIRLGSHPYFVEGATAAGTQSEITVLRARASYGEPGPWQPTFNADKIVFSPGKELRSENVTVGIGHTQPVPIPRFNQSLNAPFFGSGDLNGGFRRSLGVFAEAAVRVPVSPGVRLGADLGIYTQRGIMIGPSGRYVSPDSPERMHGYFRSGYIDDHGTKGSDLLGRPVPEERAFAEWQHQQTLAPDLTVAAQLHWWKDSEVYRDFRSRYFFPLQEPDTFAEAVYSGRNYYVSLFTRLQPNRFHRVQERLPELRFDLLPHVVGPGFVQRFEASAAVLRADAVPDGTGTAFPLPAIGFGLSFEPSATELQSGGPDRRTTRLDAYYGIERPVPVTGWFTFTPVAGARVTRYSANRESRLRSQTVFPPPTAAGFFPAGFVRYFAELESLGTYTRTLGEIGADAVLRASGTFDYRNPQWQIDGLRHLVTPRLGYRYIPRADKGRAYIPQIDRFAFSTYLQPLGLGAARNIDELYETNTLRLAFDNILQTRAGAAGTRDLLALNVANDFRFVRRPGERTASETHLELAAFPASWLQLDLYQSFAPQTFTLRELNSGLTVRDGRFWSVRFGNNYLRQQLQDYLIDGRIRLNERLDLATRLHYDARRRRFNEQTYGLVQNLGNTWLISYNVSVYSGRRRESSFGFNIQIDTVRF
jgi:LPS-assembly protein